MHNSQLLLLSLAKHPAYFTNHSLFSRIQNIIIHISNLCVLCKCPSPFLLTSCLLLPTPGPIQLFYKTACVSVHLCSINKWMAGHKTLPRVPKVLCSPAVCCVVWQGESCVWRCRCRAPGLLVELSIHNCRKRPLTDWRFGQQRSFKAPVDDKLFWRWQAFQFHIYFILC